MLENLGLILGIGIPAILLLIIFFISYVIAPPNKAIIISGKRKEPKILIGKSGIKIPFFDRKDHLNLGQISIDIKTKDFIPTKDFIGVTVDAVAKVEIMTDGPELRTVFLFRYGDGQHNLAFCFLPLRDSGNTTLLDAAKSLGNIF